jgi:hypothetical protein
LAARDLPVDYPGRAGITAHPEELSQGSDQGLFVPLGAGFDFCVARQGDATGFAAGQSPSVLR